jgi:hypothetical protein
MSLDKTAYKKTSDSLLFNSLRKFNIACKKGDIDKSLEGLLKNAGKQNFSGAAFAGGVLAGAGVIAFLITLTKVLIPLLQDLVYIFYASRQNTSDYFAIQADLLQANTAQIIYRNDINEATKKKIIQKQTAIAKKFRDISNRYAIDMTTSEKNAKELAKSEKRKYSVDTTSELPSDSLF